MCHPERSHRKNARQQRAFLRWRSRRISLAVGHMQGDTSAPPPLVRAFGTHLRGKIIKTVRWTLLISLLAAIAQDDML